MSDAKGFDLVGARLEIVACRRSPRRIGFEPDRRAEGDDRAAFERPMRRRHRRAGERGR